MSILPNKSQLWIKVLYDFKYTTREGQDVMIVKDEKLKLLEKTNSDWWHAQRITENEPFYVPATYVEEVENNVYQENKNTTSTPVPQRRGPVEEVTHQSNEPENQDSTKEEKKNHESFRNVIRKLSGNLNSSSTKPIKMVKVTKKNSMNSHDEKSTKTKDSLSETSTFAKCFGRDMKNSDNRSQNRFQEELETALVNRCQRNIVYSSKMNEHSEQKLTNNETQVVQNLFKQSAEKAVSQYKLEKLTEKVQEKSRTIESLTKEFECRAQKFPKTKSTVNNISPTNEIANQSILKKPVIQKSKLKIDLPKQKEEQQLQSPTKSCMEEEIPNYKTTSLVSTVSEMDDEAILKDNRKMWAIERLMTELLKSSEDKEVSSEASIKTKGAGKLADELHKMQTNKCNEPKENQNIFDFSVSPNVVMPKTVTKKSPKVLDEYNEANILNDNDNEEQKKLNYEKPSYSSVSFRTRKKNPSGLCMKLKSLDSELQLTPSLEKLASEIQFIPANKAAEKMKQCSKSDSALNEFIRPKVTSSTFGSLDKNYDCSKKSVKPKRLRIFNRKLSFVVKSECDKSKQLKRKTRSLDDLNLVEEEESDTNLNNNENTKSVKKPMPLFKSADSLKKSLAKPIPAKRKIYEVFEGSGNIDAKASFTGSCENVRRKWPIDLERSTAVGFKTLLRTSDSGSEEFLQNKTFPKIDDRPKCTSEDNLFQELDNFNVSDISRNPSSEIILSSVENSECNINASFEASGNTDNFVQLPEGWKQEIDLKTKQLCYVNNYGDKWFSSNDSEGKIYFFEENSNKSSWALPSIKDKSVSDNKIPSRHNSFDNLKVIDLKISRKTDESREMMTNLKHSNWPQLFHGNMCILKEGFLNRTKITEHGKKLKKCWSTSYAVLTELFLLFFRDEKIFSAMKMGHLLAKPDISVDLNGASIESGEKFSSRRNVFLISTIFGLQVLIQSDNSIQSAEWYQEIQDAIKALPSGRNHGQHMYNEE